jgi:hypothetical protein
MVSEAKSAVSRVAGVTTAAGVATGAGAGAGAAAAAAFVSGSEGSGAFFLEQAAAAIATEQRATWRSVNAIEKNSSMKLRLRRSLMKPKDLRAIKPKTQSIQRLKFVNCKEPLCDLPTQKIWCIHGAQLS